MRVAAAGDRGLLLELGDVEAATLHAVASRARQIDGVRACITGHSSLLVIFDGEPRRDELIQVAENPGRAEHAGRAHVFDVSFEETYAPDLREFLALHDLSRREFLDRVSALTLTARYIGFRGGFAYLDGWPAEWAMPRRPTSRPVVPAGSFAIAGSMAGFYPIDSPGGWNILGRTGAELEFAIAAGDEVRIRPAPIGARVSPRARAAEDSRAPFELVQAPLCRMVGAEDWSRVDRGIPEGGPFDLEAAAAANRAVGNDESAPILECPLVGPRVRAKQDGFASWSGASTDITVDDKAVNSWQFEVKQGQTIAAGRIRNGLRGYLAFGTKRGPVDIVERGDRLHIDVILGPHETPLRELECEVTHQLDRVGIRLRPLQRLGVAPPADLPSCGMQCGTLQLHPDGSVVAMGPDRPITGGYLQPMTVVSRDRWKLAQLAPGERVVFRPR